MANRTQVCNVDTGRRIEEILTLFIARGIIKENIVLSKLPKTGNNSCTNWVRCTYNVTYCHKKIVDIITAVHYRQFENFTGVPIRNFIPDWEPDIVNQPGQQTYLSANLCYCSKRELFCFHWRIFFQAGRNSVKGKFTRRT